MSCNCGCYPCNCRLGSEECACQDPGLEVTGRGLPIYDYAFCQRRLQNASGVLECFVNGSGNAMIKWSAEPKIRYTELEVADGSTFSHLVAALGDSGTPRRLVPAEGADGFLRAKNGVWSLVDPTTEGDELFTVPDPLTLTTLNVTSLNATTPVVSGTPTFSGLSTDTITQTIGLNASNQLVKGSSTTISVARFFENPTLLSTSLPNDTAANASAPVKFSYEIYDADNIASPTGADGVKIDKTGEYVIEWFGQFTGRDPSAGTAGPEYNPGLWLYINGALVSWGNDKAITQNRLRGDSVSGKEVMHLNANDLLTIRLNGGAFPSNTGLRGVGMVLTKFK